MIQFRKVQIRFDPTRGRVQEESQTVGFGGRKVNSVEAVLRGFDIKFSNGDHHVSRQMIDLESSFNQQRNEFTVEAKFLLRDDSGNIDDRYEGFIEAMVIADLE